MTPPLRHAAGGDVLPPPRAGHRAAGDPRRRRIRRVAQALLSVALVAGIFGFALPRLADFADVWATIARMTWREAAVLVVAAALNLAGSWLVMIASLPGSTLWQSALVNQASTAVSNTIPAGGAIAAGVTYAMYGSFGFTVPQITLSVLVSGIWNNFVKFGMPAVALAVLAFQGRASAQLVTATAVGIAALAGALALFALALWREELARRTGAALGRAASAALRLARRPPVRGWDGAAARLRVQVIELVHDRWARLTWTSVLSQLLLFAVLLIALRAVGVSQDEVDWVQALAAFSFGRLVTALPVTPGGLGVMELTLTAALVAAGGDATPVAAAVLVYRALTYLPPIVLGGPAYVVWRVRYGGHAHVAAARSARGGRAHPRSTGGPTRGTRT